MLDFGHAILKGVMQGLTEFLPISSSAHLVFIEALAHYFGWTTYEPVYGEEEFFNVLLHIGTLGAVLYYFRWDVRDVLKQFLEKDAKPKADQDHGAKIDMKSLPVMLAISCVFMVFFVLLGLKGSEKIFEMMAWTTENVEDISDYFLEHPQFVAGHLIITGFLLFFTDRMSAKRKTSEQLSKKHAIWIGIFSAVSGVFRGISRSGSTISAGLATGLDRVTATRYSFLLSIPTFIMAGVYEAMKLIKLDIAAQLNWPAMLLGTVVSGIVGYFCVKYFIQFVSRHSLVGFACYCWTVGLLMLFFLSQGGG